MWRWEDAKMKMWRWEDVRMRRCEDVKIRRAEECVKMKIRRCENEKMWIWEDVKTRGYEDEDVKMRRCDDRPPLLEEAFAQTPDTWKKVILYGYVNTTIRTHQYLRCWKLPRNLHRKIDWSRVGVEGPQRSGSTMRKTLARHLMLPENKRDKPPKTWQKEVPGCRFRIYFIFIWSNCLTQSVQHYYGYPLVI